MNKSVVIFTPLLSCLLVFVTFNNPHAPEAQVEKTPVRARRQLLETESEMDLKLLVHLVTPLMAILRPNRTSVTKKMDAKDTGGEFLSNQIYNTGRSSYGYSGGGYGGGGCGGGCGGCGGCGGGYGGYGDCCEDDVLPILALIALSALFIYLVFINGGAGKRRRRAVLLDYAEYSSAFDPIDRFNNDDVG